MEKLDITYADIKEHNIVNIRSYIKIRGTNDSKLKVNIPKKNLK